jgi:hypothetical protein
MLRYRFLDTSLYHVSARWIELPLYDLSGTNNRIDKTTLLNRLTDSIALTLSICNIGFS